MLLDTSDPPYRVSCEDLHHRPKRRSETTDLTKRVEAFLRDHGARTEHERHSETDIRVLATIE